jgi:hypothetical protein
MTYKVIQWGTGSVGQAALSEMLTNPLFEVVGVKVYSAAKVGVDAGTLCGASEIGVKAVMEIDALPLSNTDCIVYCPMVADYAELEQLLKAGVNVVTTASNVYPQFYGPGVFDNLNNAGLEGNASFHGSGINPAFMSDVLPLTISGLSHRAKKITVREVSDVNHYASTAPEIMLDHIGFGKTPAEALKEGDFLKGMTAYFSESIASICDHLDVPLDRIEEDHRVATSRVRVVLDNGRVIEPGTVGCRLFEWTGIVGGEPRVVLSTFWKVTTDIEPAWDVQTTDVVEWTITVEGTPSFRCKIETCTSFDSENPECGKGGEFAAVLATATHAINAIPIVCDAAPGVRTFLDLPIIPSQGAFLGL